MIAYYGSKISEHMTKTPEGFLICHDVPIARIGQQEYFAGELGLDGDPDRLVQVQRLSQTRSLPAARWSGRPLLHRCAGRDLVCDNR